MRIQTSEIKSWGSAKKTKPIKAKPLINLLVDRSVLNLFLIDTLEGKASLKTESVICIGEAGDVWQQAPDKLLSKYNVTAIDKDGWMMCDPKPDVIVDCIEVIPQVMNYYLPNPINPLNQFSIIGHYGETINGEANVQNGVAGDFILRNREDITDVWIVKRKLFLNTYSIRD